MKKQSKPKIYFYAYPPVERSDKTSVTLLCDTILNHEQVVELKNAVNSIAYVSGVNYCYVLAEPHEDVTCFPRSAPECWAILQDKITRVPVSHEEEQVIGDEGRIIRYVVADVDLQEVEENELVGASMKLLIPHGNVLWEDPTRGLGPAHSSKEELEAFEGFLRMLREHPDAAVLVDRLRRLGFVQGIDRVKINLTFPRDESI